MQEKSKEILQKRFDVVKKMYFSDKVIAANKNDLILNWILEQFGNPDHHKKSSCIYELLWKTFYEILEKENQSSSRHRILIKSNAAVNLLNAVANYPHSNTWASIILSSITLFLQTPSVNSTLLADIDTLFLLLIATLKVICKVYISNCEDVKSLKEAKNLGNVILDILENLPTSNEIEKILLFSGSLQDLALFMHIAENDKKLDFLNEKLAKKIVSIVFNLKNKLFNTLFTPVHNFDPVERPNTYILQFFLSLHNMLLNEDSINHSVSVNTACATLMKKLLTTFLLQKKSNVDSLKVISLFFAAAGLDIPITMDAKTCCNSLFKEQISNSEVLIVGLSHLLEASLVFPQFFTSASVPEGYIKPLMWLKGVSVALLDMEISKNKSFWLKCIHSVVLISPSIIEDCILPIVKTAFLNISLRNAESKKQYCELFDSVLKAHSKLHQVPKFFVKLLLAVTECIKENSIGKFLVRGQLLPQIQESVAKCVQELPHGHMISLCLIFIETFATLESMCEIYNVSKGIILFVAQLFSTFLLHVQLFQANIPSNITSHFIKLIENISVEVEKIISCLKESDSKFVPLQSSVLLLFHAIGELKLTYIAYYGKFPESFETGVSDGCFNFSLLHKALDKEYASALETFMNSDDKILSILVFQLLLQKFKALQFKENISEEGKSQMKELISVILRYLQESTLGSESWDMDISTVTAKNYGTAYWQMFLKVSPLLLNHFEAKNFYDLCYSIQSVINQNERVANCSETHGVSLQVQEKSATLHIILIALQKFIHRKNLFPMNWNSDVGAKSVIISSLNSEFFHESNLFQTAIFAVIWKQENLLYSKKRSHGDMEAGQSSLEKIFLLLSAYHTKALKYAQRTPKSNKNLGKFWNEIVEISNILNMVLTESLPKEKIIIEKAYNFIKLLKSLPLEYLLPGNQMRCITGLSLLFFLIPQSCKSREEAALLAREISMVLVSIFEGVRSVWLFDFLASGPYLKYVVKTLDSVIEFECNEDWAVHLIEHLISLIVKTTESLNGVEQCISELTVKNKWSRITVIIMCELLKKLSQVISHFHKHEAYKESLVRMSSYVSQVFIKHMNKNFKEDMEDTDHVFFIKCYSYVIDIICKSNEVAEIRTECFKLFPMVLKVAVNKVTSSSNDGLSNIYLLFISKIGKNSSKLSEFLPEDFVSTSWKICLSHFKEKIERKKKSLTSGEKLNSELTSPSSNCKMCIFCSSYSNEKLQLKCDEDDKIAENSNQSCKILSAFTLSESEVESLKELSTITTEEKLAEVFQNILEELSTIGKPEIDVLSLQSAISICQFLIDVNTTKFNNPVLNQSLQKFLSHLSFIVNQVCSSAVCQVMVLIPVLDFMSFIVVGNKGLPREVLLQSLHFVAPVSLEVHNNNYVLFVKTFTAAWNLVYNLFMHHTNLMLQARAPFLSYVAKLLRSILKAGTTESLSKLDINMDKKVQFCAQNMNRLLTVITRNKIEFSKLVPYLVADYVDAVQNITLDPKIKESILLGIHRLLDICSEDSIKMQAANISYVCREIYGNLVKSYKQNRHAFRT